MNIYEKKEKIKNKKQPYISTQTYLQYPNGT